MLLIFLKGRAAMIIKKALNMNSYLAIIVGSIVTFIVQSSVIITSTLVPLVGLELISLERMFPIVIGSCILFELILFSTSIFP
jgi:sodium-dependent phosphate cotransporter